MKKGQMFWDIFQNLHNNVLELSIPFRFLETMTFNPDNYKPKKEYLDSGIKICDEIIKKASDIKDVLNAKYEDN